MIDLLVAAGLLAGAFFMLTAALGILRLPDIYSRMQAAAKAGTLGKMFLVTAAALHFGELGIASRAVMIILLFFMTAPVAAHLLGRAAFLDGSRFSAATYIDPEARAGLEETTSAPTEE